MKTSRGLADQFRKVFGTQHHVGQAIFHDAIPAAKPTLEVDVMTVHYPEYYQGNNPPADTQSPNPIPFLTVGRTPFLFAVGWQGDPNQATYDKAVEIAKVRLNRIWRGGENGQLVMGFLRNWLNIRINCDLKGTRNENSDLSCW